MATKARVTFKNDGGYVQVEGKNLQMKRMDGFTHIFDGSSTILLSFNETEMLYVELK